MQKYTKFDVWLRGSLYAGIAGIGYLLNDETFRAVMPRLDLVYLGAFSAILLAVRAFIDLTAGRTQIDEAGTDEAVPVQVVNTPDNAVPTDAQADTQAEAAPDAALDNAVADKAVEHRAWVQAAKRNPSD